MGHHDHGATLQERSHHDGEGDGCCSAQGHDCCAPTGAASLPAEIVHRPTATVGGSFTLENHFGERVSETSFPGRHLLIFFGFTHCRTVCPAALSRIDQVMSALRDDAEAVQPLYITVDPARDTPPVMRAFLDERHPKILGLTGTPAEIERTMRSFHAFAERREDDTDPDSYLMPHSAFTYLMDDQGRYLTHFTDAASAAEITEDISGRLHATGQGNWRGKGREQ